jgi:hypothetical protein
MGSLEAGFDVDQRQLGTQQVFIPYLENSIIYGHRHEMPQTHLTWRPEARRRTLAFSRHAVPLQLPRRQRADQRFHARHRRGPRPDDLNVAGLHLLPHLRPTTAPLRSRRQIHRRGELGSPIMMFCWGRPDPSPQAFVNSRGFAHRHGTAHRRLPRRASTSPATSRTWLPSTWLSGWPCFYG